MIKDAEDELRVILDSNPFRNVVDEWRAQIEAFNCGNLSVDNLKFALPSDDETLVAECTKKLKCPKEEWDAHLHFELLPDVFRGYPRAPVWVLLLNPGFSEVDWYDHLGLCPICKERLVRTDGIATKHPNGCASKWFDAELDNPSEALDHRQKTLLKSLCPNLDNPQNFFWFDGEFHTISRKCKALNGQGGYLWWKNNLFGTGAKTKTRYILPECGIAEDSAAVGRKIFALELFPYHSRNFGKGVITRKKSAFRKSEYLKFWRKLVGWALKTDRKLIVRSKTILDELKNIDGGVKSRSVFRQSSWQNAAFTYDNTIGEDMGNGKPDVSELYDTITH